MRSLLVPAVLSMMLAWPVLAEEPRHSGEEGGGAFRHVLQLAGAIGPRKSGTDADRRAIEYIAREMEDAGLSVTRQEVSVSQYAEGERSVGSWNVIGELSGASRDTVVVGAHHDTHSEAVPGANDDASGVAVLLSVARLTALRPHRMTYRFISFCAEEEGLLGSRYYVEHSDLSPVRAMIALELVGRGELVVGPVPRPPSLWAQELLLQAARETGARGVVARPIWSIAPRLLGLPFSADHEPFLDHKIPAFLVMGTFPEWGYHTSEDGANGVRPEAIDRAVRVVDRLLQDLESASPEHVEDAHYLPLMLLGRGVLIPSPVLMLVSVGALLGWGLVALLHLRSIARLRAIALTLRVVIVLGAATALGLSGMFLSEWVMERIHGTRFPWMAHQGLNVGQGAAWSLVTSWLGLKLFRRIKPTVEPGPYLAAALLIPVAGIGAALRLGFPEVAIVMAVPLLMFLVSLRFESTGRKLACGLGALAPFTCLLALRDYRTLIDLGGVAPPVWALFAIAFVVAFPLIAFLAHVASFQSCLHSRIWWWLSGGRVGALTLIAALSLLGTNALLPSYDYRYRQVVRLRQRVELNAKKAVATIRSKDTLRGVQARGEPSRALDPRATTERIVLPFPIEGLDFTAEAAPGEGLGETLVTTRLHAPLATDRVSYVFTSRSGFKVPGRGDELRHTYTFAEIIPRRDPVASFRLQLPEKNGDLSVDLRAEFAGDLLHLEPRSDGPLVFVHQASIEGSRQLLGAPRSGEETAKTPTSR